MEKHFRNYQINHKFQEKGRGYNCLKLRKRKVKTNNQIPPNGQIPHYNWSRSQSNIETMFTRKLIKNQTYLKILLLYLNNPSEETISGSNKIKEQYETMKLQMNECSEILKNLINQLSRPGISEKLLRKSYLYYNILTSTKLKYFMSYRMKLRC